MDDCATRSCLPRGILSVVCLMAVWVGTALPARGQQRWFGRPTTVPCPPPPLCPPVPVPGTPRSDSPPAPSRPESSATPPAAQPQPTDTPATAPPLSFEGGPAARGDTFAYATPNLQGDQLGIPALAFGQRGNPRYAPFPGQVPSAVVVPSVRSFKIAENDSPFPRDRAYFGFNYYQDVNKAVNLRLGSDLQDLRAQRATFGLEKTFFDGDFSAGFRLPLDTLRADSRVPGLAGDSTDVGNLSLIFKAALWGDRQAGRVLTTGLAVTVPTGSDRFAGFSNISPVPNSTILQPFVGGVWGMGDLFVHGYSAIDFPTRSNDVTVWYNDIGLGYFLHRERTGTAFLSAVVPTVELHINSPLNHRGILRTTDPAGTPDVFALTSGVSFEFNRRATLSLGYVVPMSGPRPFDWEVLAQLNIRLGAGNWFPNVLGN